MVTIQSAENALKSVYLGAITELLNTKTNPLLTKIEQTSADVCGKEIRKAAKFGLNGGIGAGTETGTLPTASSTKYLQFVVTLKNLYGQIEISDKAIRAGVEGSGAFADLLNSELEDLLNASKFNLGRMLYGNGSGLLCSINNATTMTVNNTRNLMPGMLVDVYEAGEAIGTSIRIESVNHSNKVIGLSSTVTGIKAGSGLYVQGSKDKEITGIGALFETTGTLYGLSRSSNPFLTSYSKSLTDSIDESTLERVIDKLQTEANSNIDFIAISADAKYAYQNYMAQYKRNIDVMQLEGGFKSLSYNGIPLVYDRFVPAGEMYFLDTSAFKLHQLCDWRYIETENGKILRQTEGKPTYSATLVKYCDLICDRPNGQGRLQGVSD